MDTLYLIAGFFLGIMTGLLPGLHSNTVISALSSMGLEGWDLALVIIALFPAHLVFSFIPSIFFGVPEAGTELSVLPGQRMVMQGQGQKAFKTVLLSIILSAIISCALFGISLELFPAAYGILRPHMKFVLLGVSVILLARTKKPLLSAAIFSLAGIMGHFSLNSGMADPFLPLFCGMFALAAMSRWNNGTLPEQEDAPAEKGIVKFVMIGVLFGMAADMVPGVGSPSQAAVFATMIMPMDTPGYLATISSISISQAVFSLSTSASIGKCRVGATAWLDKQVDIGENLALLLALFIAGLVLAAGLAHALRHHAAKLATADFSSLRFVLGAYLILITLIIDGMPGLIVLALSTGLGMLTLRLGVERTNLMGAIIVPTLMLLFRLFL